MRKGIIAAILMASLLTGCSIPYTVTGERKEDTKFSNTYDLEAEKIYVWKEKGYGDLKKDLSKERAGSDIFYKAPEGTISFAGKQLEKESIDARNIWFEEGAEDKIPTVTRDDAILYISEKKVPDGIIYERFADNGYSIGIAGMHEDKGGHFYIPYGENSADDYKSYIDPNSGASALFGFEGIERLYFDKAGDISVSENTVSKGGVLQTLTKDKDYVCQFYTGTFYQDFTLKANVRTFTSMEWFEGYDYEFLHANCIRLQIPEYFKSGYYMVLGKGLIRYVAPQDEETFSKGEGAIDWNDPIRIYDENGICIYDPSDGTGIDEMSDPGIDKEEINNNGQTETKPEEREEKDGEDSTVF